MTALGLQRLSGQIEHLTNLYAIQEQAETKLSAVIKTTGKSVGFTANEMIAQVQSLQKITTYGDESIISMQSVLATFKSIKGDNFKRTAELALDLSTVMGQD